MPRATISRLAPYLARGVDHELHLRFLLGEAEPAALLVAGEAALRAHRQVFQRNETRSAVDFLPQVAFAFERRDFRRYHAQHHALAFRYVAQRLEAAGALAVELEEEGVDV